MEDVYPKAYREVYEVLKNISKEDLEKIPQDIKETIENNMDIGYKYKLKENIDFEEQNLLQETKALLAIIYRDYWATDVERKRIIEREQYDKRIFENELKERYNPDNIFKNRKVKEMESCVQTQEIVKYKEKIFIRKVLEKIKRLFKRK